MANKASGVLTSSAMAVGGITLDDSSQRIVFVISGLAAETVTVTGTVHAAVVTGGIRPIDVTTRAAAAASALPNGSYLIDKLAYEKLTFTKSGATDPAVISFAIVSAA